MYAEPRRSLTLKDCWFYHTIDLPDVGMVEGWWDLRGIAAPYLGNVDFKGQRVLEVGPASGFLTAWMDQQGAEVVALEQPESAVWDFVPLDIRNPNWSDTKAVKTDNQHKLKNAFWLTHEKFNLSAKALYRKVEDIPPEVGDFDIAVLAMVLTHMRDPLRAIDICARRAKKKLVITERLHVPPSAQDFPVLWYVPKKGGRRDTWWHFSRGFFQSLLEGMGFARVTFSDLTCPVRKNPAYPVTSIVAEW